MLSWAVQRDIFYTERDRIRREFETNLHLKDLGVVEKAIADGEAKLAEYAHPDPYTVPTAYGGSKYARNPPPPGCQGGDGFRTGRVRHPEELEDATGTIGDCLCGQLVRSEYKLSDKPNTCTIYLRRFAPFSSFSVFSAVRFLSPPTPQVERGTYAAIHSFPRCVSFPIPGFCDGTGNANGFFSTPTS
jgi:hypothetical protein